MPRIKERIKKQHKQLLISLVTKVLMKSRQDNSVTVTNEDDKEIPKERCMSPKERQKNMIKYRSIIMEYQKTINLLHNMTN